MAPLEPLLAGFVWTPCAIQAVELTVAGSLPVADQWGDANLQQAHGTEHGKT